LAEGRFVADRFDVRFARLVAGRLAEAGRLALERFAVDRFDDRLLDDFDRFLAIKTSA
jgi:hypothetical protein